MLEYYENCTDVAYEQVVLKDSETECFSIYIRLEEDGSTRLNNILQDIKNYLSTWH